MSKIMDLVAEVEGIDDLKPTYNREFFDKVQKDDEARAIKQIFNKGIEWSSAYDWFKANAEFGCGYDDEGHKEIYFENFVELCDRAATEMTDAYIEEQHFDMNDEQYSRVTDKVGDMLADFYADTESQIIKEYEQDGAEMWAQFQTYNTITLPKE